MRSAILIFGILSLVPRAFAQQTDLRIGEIHITTENVFSADEIDGRAYALANRLHVTTRESLIRKFLLFEEGGPYDPEKLNQTERNLRGLGFLRSVSVTAGPPHDGVVDVEVVTHDSWSTQPEVSAGSKGGGSKVGLNLTEENLFGTGRQLTIGYRNDPDRTSKFLIFADPSIRGPYTAGRVSYESATDGMAASLDLARPFHDTEGRWSWGVSYDRTDRERKLYTEAVVSDLFQRVHDGVKFEAGRALTTSPLSAQRIFAGLDWDRARFYEPDAADVPVTLPRDRELRTFYVGYDYLFNRYIKQRYVDRGPLEEDFNLGTTLSFRVGISPEWAGVDATTYSYRAGLEQGWRTSPNTFAIAGVDYETRSGEINRNELISGRFQLIHEHASRVHQTTIGTATVDLGDELDLDRQLELDGANGLPGYRLHAYTGTSRATLGLEHRMFSSREYAHLLTPGLAVFADGGWIDSPESGSDTIADAGVGLLFYITRSSHNLIRVDLAYPFVADPLGRKGIVVSVSTGSRF